MLEGAASERYEKAKGRTILKFLGKVYLFFMLGNLIGSGLGNVYNLLGVRSIRFTINLS